MATHLVLDDALVEQAMKAGQHKTKREAVTAALKEYIVHRKQQDIINLFGTINFVDDYNYKAERKR
jgi:hypothetical protein